MAFARMRFLAALLTCMLVSGMALAVHVISPVSTEIAEGPQIAMGTAGPGQTFYVVADPVVASGGRFNQGGAYDQMSASALPEGWSSAPSKLYAKPLQTDVTIPKDAPDGEYIVYFSLWDEAGEAGLGQNVTFAATVQVSRDVMEMKVEPSSQSVGAGQPARYAITINNKGIANDVFLVGSSGVRDWEFQRSIYITSGTSKTVSYEVVGNDEADYTVKIWARSSSSENINSKAPVSLRVNTDLLSDFRATTNGVLLFPLPEAPLYFIAGLMSNLFP